MSELTAESIRLLEEYITLRSEEIRRPENNAAYRERLRRQIGRLRARQVAAAFQGADVEQTAAVLAQAFNVPIEAARQMLAQRRSPDSNP